MRWGFTPFLVFKLKQIIITKIHHQEPVSQHEKYIKDKDAETPIFGAMRK